MILLILLVAIQVLSLNEAFNFSCPSQAQWKLRAQSKCKPARNYTCLFDLTRKVNSYRDRCSEPRIMPAGNKYVFQPNLNKATCSITRYQPFIFETVGYSDCIFLKSLCNSIGQKAYGNGSTTSDRTCLCDNTSGYTFVMKQGTQSYCKPISEDCSCYFNIHPNNKLNCSKDFKCSVDIDITQNYALKDSFDITQSIRNIVYDNCRYNLAFPTNEYRIAASVFIIIVSVNLVVLVVYILYRICQQHIQPNRREEIKGIKAKIKNVKEDKERIQSKVEKPELEQEDPVPSHIRGREEIKGIKAKIKNVKGDKERIQSKVEKLELEQEDPVPSHIREQIKGIIDDWKIKDMKFICTRAYEDVRAKISSNNCACVAVTGSGGSGKSAILRHVSLLLYKESGFDIIIVSFPIDLRNYYKPGRKTLFVLEDVCGQFTVNQQQIDHWISMKDVLNQVMADDLCKILLTCRLQVYKDEKFSALKAFKTCECNIISEDLYLTMEEKKKFLKTYLNLENLEVDIISGKNDMFPFLCDQYLTEKGDLDIVKYFNTPYPVYQTELEELKTNDKYKLCALCLCIMLNNQLKEDYFKRLTKEFKKIVKNTCEYCGLSRDTSAIRLKDELDTLDKTYISKHDGVYEVYHDKLFDFMAYYFGQMMTQCFIDHADSAFLRERFIWEKAIDTDEHLHDIEHIVSLGDNFLQSYIDRMISDWSNGKVSDVFYNINMKSPSFREKFLQGLNGIGEIQAIELSNMKDVFRDDFASDNTPLIISCVDGYVDLLKWLLDHEANVNNCRKDGSSGLYMACQKNNVDAVKMLLQNNADVNLCTDEGVSPLGIACYSHGNLQIICPLLQNKAEVNMYRLKVNNMTPLFMACQDNHVACVMELLKYEADPYICLHDGMSVLLLACQNEYTELVHLLIQYSGIINAEMRDGDTPLFSVSHMGFIDITKILLENGADCNRCLHSKEEIEKSLESTSQSFEAEKLTWFKNVECYGSEKTVAYINTQSADYVFDVFAGSAPLHVACFMGHIEICKLLTNKLSSVDIKKKDGTTPLFYACEIGHHDIVRDLLEKGADPNICRDNQSSPFTISETNGHADVLSLLNDYYRK